MGKWEVIILFYSTFLFAPCDACPPLIRIRNKIDGRQVEGFIVTKYTDKGDCNHQIVRSYTATKGGEASSARRCDLLYVTGKLKVPVTPPISIPIVGEVPSVTLPGNEEQCKTYNETNTNPFDCSPSICDKYLDVIRDATTNECVIVEGNRWLNKVKIKSNQTKMKNSKFFYHSHCLSVKIGYSRLER